MWYNAVRNRYEMIATLKEIVQFLFARKLLWLAPVVLALVLLFMLMLVGGKAGVLSPLIYAM